MKAPGSRVKSLVRPILAAACFLNLLTHTQAAEPVPVPRPSERVLQFYRGNNVIWIVAQVLGLAIPLGFVLTGLSARLANWCQRRARRWALAVPLFAALYTIVTAVVLLPLSYWTGYVRLHSYGLSNQDLPRWLDHWAKNVGLDAIGFALVGLGIYALIRRFPRRWWLAAGLISLPFMLFVAVIQPVVLDPLFNHYTPLEDAQLEVQVRALADRAGIGDSRIEQVDRSRDTKALNAFVNGWLGTRRIVIWDTLLDRMDDDEVIAVVGHEIGHYVLGHVLRGVAVASLLVLVGLGLADRLSRFVIARYGQRLGLTGLSDIAALPLLLAAVQLITLLLMPIGLAHSRWMEHEADRFGLELTRLNHAAATSFVKMQDTNLSHPEPGPLYRFWRASHPSLAQRIEFCNSYEPWNTGQPPRYAAFIQGSGALDAPAGSR